MLSKEDSTEARPGPGVTSTTVAHDGSRRSVGRGALAALALAFAQALASCTPGAPEPATPPEPAKPPAPAAAAGQAGVAPANRSLAAAPLSSPILELEKVEELSESVANHFIDFSYAIQRRDFARAKEYLDPGFLGTAFPAAWTIDAEDQGLGVRVAKVPLDAALAAPADRDAFLGSVEKIVAELESVEFVFFKTRGAEFESDESRAILRMTANIIGSGERRRALSLNGWAQAEVVKTEAGWMLRRFALESLQVLQRDAPIFTDVASSAGVSYLGPRLGTAGNTSFYWQGAATADVDGDGLLDLFTSTYQRNFLFRNRGDGRFEDKTEAAGLLQPAGVTGPLFLDYDNDGDQDLLCSHVGWTTDGVPHGEPLHLYRNEGGLAFKDVSEEAGLASLYVNGFSLAAADFDGDGWLDVYVCNYNRLDAVYPNSWFRATNGSPNLLLHNQDGKTFKDVAAEAGVAGHDWSYAAAIADFDEDGDQDIYVANDYGDNALYRSTGGLHFENVAAALGVLDTGNGMGAAWGDLDNDGKLDLYVSNMSSSAGNRILKRLAAATSAAASPGSKGSEPSVQGTLLKLASGNSIFRATAGGFERVPADRGGVSASWAWSPALLDMDLDGTQDIYVANGFISGDSLKDT